MLDPNVDVIWLLPLFLGALLLLASAFSWFRVAHGTKVHGVAFAPGDAELKNAASITSLALGLMALAIFGWLWVRF